MKPIADSGVKPITQSGQADHLSERSDAEVHHTVLNGFAARFTMASDMLHELAAQDSDTSLARRLRRFTGPQLLAIDEDGHRRARLARRRGYHDRLDRIRDRRRMPAPYR